MSQRHMVHIEPAGISFAVAADETILDAALNAGIDYPFRCRQGVCTACVCRLKSGEVSYDEPSPLSATDKAQNFVDGCQA